MKLGEICSFLNGGTPSKEVAKYFEGDIPWITGADILGPVVNSARSHITEEAISASATNRVPTRTVLLVTRTSVGKVAISGVELCYSQDITALKPNLDQLNIDYLVHFLRSQESYLKSQSRGATIKGITKSVLQNLDIPLPPIATQKHIAAILDQAEELRSKRRSAIALLDELGRSVFLEMFGDPYIHGWPIESINEILNGTNGAIRTGPFGSQLLHSEFTDQGIAVLGIDNAVANEFRWGERRFISELKYQELKRYTVKPGDVIITIMGTCGRCAIVPDNIPISINTKHVCCITLDLEKCLPRFLHAYFLIHPIAKKYLEQTMKGAIMSGLNMGIIRAMPIPRPPLALQQQFAERMEAIETLKATHRQSLAKLDTLFASLQHRAFRGEL